MKRIFFDANVLFTAAHNPRGKASLVIKYAQEGHWKLFTSVYAIGEAQRNIEIKYPDKLGEFEALLKNFAIVKSHKDHPCPAGLTKKDQPIFRAAMECSATHLLTGDSKDFGRFMNHAEGTFNINIQTIAGFLASIV